VWYIGSLDATLRDLIASVRCVELSMEQASSSSNQTAASSSVRIFATAAASRATDTPGGIRRRRARPGGARGLASPAAEGRVYATRAGRITFSKNRMERKDVVADGVPNRNPRSDPSEGCVPEWITSGGTGRRLAAGRVTFHNLHRGEAESSMSLLCVQPLPRWFASLLSRCPSWHELLLRRLAPRTAIARRIRCDG